MIVDGASNRIVLKAPHLIQELVTRDDFVFMENKAFQYFEFTRRQVYRSSRSHGTIFPKVKFNISKPIPLQRSYSICGPPQMCPNASQELLDAEWLALNAQSGKLIWNRDLGAKVTTSAAIQGTDLYLGTAKRHLYRLNVDSGDVLGDTETQAAPNGRLLLVENSLLAFLGDEIFTSFDLDLKKVRWSREASKQWTSARPYPWHNVVLAGNRREFVAFRTSDGARQWLHQFPETIRGIGTSPDVLYVGTLTGPIFAYSPK